MLLPSGALGSALLRQCAVIPPSEPSHTKKVDIIDLTLESSSEEEEEEAEDPPLKKRCLYMAKPDEAPAKGYGISSRIAEL